MRNRVRSFTLATAAVFAALFFGTAAPQALAQSNRSRGSAQGRFEAPRGNARDSGRDRQSLGGRSDSRRSFDRQSGRGFEGQRQRFVERRPFGRSYGRGFGDRFESRPFFRPYRTVRVFVAFPYPHWVLRRVYDDATVVYDQDCDPY